MREVCSWSDRHPVKVQAARKAAALTRVLPTFVPRREENAERWKWKSPLNFFILRGFLRTQNTTQVRMRRETCNKTRAVISKRGNVVEGGGILEL